MLDQNVKIVCRAVAVVPGDESVGLFPMEIALSFDDGYYLNEKEDERNLIMSFRDFIMNIYGEQPNVYLFDAEGFDVWF
jgi:hypothetical protein